MWRLLDLCRVIPVVVARVLVVVRVFLVLVCWSCVYVSCGHGSWLILQRIRKESDQSRRVNQVRGGAGLAFLYSRSIPHPVCGLRSD
jgi:hypothetical protein